MRSAADSLQVADAEDGKSSRSRSGSQSSVKSSGGSKYTNADLPFDLGTNRKNQWRNIFCSTFYEYIGTIADPWTIDTDYIQQVWDLAFPELNYKVEGTGAVFSIVSVGSKFSVTANSELFFQVSQRVCEWRGKFAREALALVKAHFESDDFKTDSGAPDTQAIADFVAQMLEHTDFGYRFVYQNTEEQVTSPTFAACLHAHSFVFSSSAFGTRSYRNCWLYTSKPSTALWAWRLLAQKKIFVQSGL